MGNEARKLSSLLEGHRLPALGVMGVALLLFGVALWGPEEVRTVLYLGAPSLIVLIVLRQWITAVENRALSIDLQQQLLDFNLLLDSGKVIASQLHKHRIEEIYSTTVKIARGLLQADVVALPILNGDGTFTYVESHGRLAEILKGRTLPVSEGGLCGWVAKNRQAAVVPDLRSDPRVIPELADQLEATTAVVVPIADENGVIGGISAFRRGKPYHAYDAQLLTIFANQVGIALENAKTYGALKKRLEELKHTQAQLVHSEKMAAIGQLVSGIAHELNNPLTSILGFSEILVNQAGLDAVTRQDLERVHEEAERARRIIQNLQHFAREEKPSRILADINEVVSRTLALIEYRLRVKNITLIKDLDPRLPMTALDVQQIEQVLLNILVNAEQAMENAQMTGAIAVATRLQPSDTITIFVRDDGPGIASEHLPKIFEPFFTTKEVGVGTGLGLSLAYGIVKQHGGRIRVESEPGRGACFILELPIAKETGSAPPLSHDAEASDT